MPLRDWIQNYPDVAALLQHDDDILHHASVEEPDPQHAAAMLGHTGAVREQWYSIMRNWARLMIRTNGPTISLHCLVPPDIFGQLCAEASPPGGPGVLNIRPTNMGWHLTLFGAITIAPWQQCRTWIAHWSVHTTQPTIVTIEVGRIYWHHIVSRPVSAAEESLPEYAVICEAYHPKLVCPCGGHLLHWRC
jgi:hypothetical protein